MTRSRSPVLRIVLSAVLLGAAGAPAKTVLCVAPSGHVAVENVLAPVCHAQAPAAAAASPADDGCPIDCRDTLLSNGVAAQASHDGPRAPAVVSGAVAAGGSAFLPAPTRSSPPRLSAGSPPRASLRGVVLRC